MNNNIPVIAIDGLASSGKTTVSKKLSEILGFYILDSGILYRTFAYLKTLENIDIFNIENINRLVQDIHLQPSNGLSFNVLFVLVS